MISKFRLNSNTATKEAINRTLQIANKYAGELSIEVLSLDQIELDPDNHRTLDLTLEDARNGIPKDDPLYEKKKADWKSLESLAKTIQDSQLINPVFVYRFGNKCRLISGERRTLASAISGKNEIIARIANQRPVGTKLRVLQWVENNERMDLSLAERIQSLEAILSAYYAENSLMAEKLTAKLLSDLTGMSMTQTRRYILILQSEPKIKNAIFDGKLENIKLIELICSLKNKEHQNQILEAAISGSSFESILKLKKALENTTLKKIETRGRKKVQVRLGSVKAQLAKFIVDALMASDRLDHTITPKIHSIYQNAKWHEIQSAEKGFKQIMLLIEGALS